MFNLLFKLFYTFFKIGIFTFGGGYAMIPLIQTDILNNGWVENINVLTDFIGISESTPGPFAINISTFIGFKQAGVWGVLAATTGVVLPSLIVILIIAAAFSKFQTNKFVIGFLKGVRPTIIGIIMSVGVSFILFYVLQLNLIDIKSFVFDLNYFWKAMVIFVIIFAITKVWHKLNPIFIIIISGILGYVIYGII